MHKLKNLLVATGLLASLSAQGNNCALLATFTNHGPFNDCWGYTAPNGDEYALLGTTTGTVVIDISTPTNPIERGWFPWASSTWRDIRTYGHYAYVVTEATSGFQIIDLQNPNAPVDLGVFGTSYTSHAHNVCVDTGAGRLYLVGTNNGTQVFDLTFNPANPSYIGQAYPAGNSNYYHDLCVENGYGYGSMIYNGKLRIFDVTAWPPTTLSNTSTPGNFTHNAWPNATGTVCVTTDEVTGGVIKLFDITNKSAPVPLGQFTPNPSSIPHNAFIVGDKCHVSWYTEGYRCIDISDPNNPVEVASYDTWPGASGGYNGCWGCYPFFPSGIVLASDRTYGLHILRPTQASFTKYGQGCPGSVAQPSTCASLNANGGTLTGNTNSYEYTFRVNNSASLQVSSFEIYTESTSGTITRNAHIYLPSGNGPSTTPFATTTITVGTQPGFYTATFASPVSVSGTFYVGYENSPGGVISNLTSGSSGTGFYRTAVTGNWSQSSLVQRPSWRVYCSGGGSNFLSPSLGNVGLPSLGSTYDVTLSDAVASSATFLMTGFSSTSYGSTTLPAPIPGAPGCTVQAAPDVTQLLFTSGSGTASVSFTIPNSSSYIGLELFHQWAVLDAVNSVGIVVSDAGKASVDL